MQGWGWGGQAMAPRGMMCRLPGCAGPTGGGLLPGGNRAAAFHAPRLPSASREEGEGATGTDSRRRRTGMSSACCHHSSTTDPFPLPLPFPYRPLTETTAPLWGSHSPLAVPCTSNSQLLEGVTQLLMWCHSYNWHHL